MKTDTTTTTSTTTMMRHSPTTVTHTNGTSRPHWKIIIFVSSFPFVMFQTPAPQQQQQQPSFFFFRLLEINVKTHFLFETSLPEDALKFD
jgi:hypothetical protein